jgi:hypothetical protein
MYRIKKVERNNKAKYFPQVKRMFGWTNIYYDFYFEDFEITKQFLDEHTNPEKEKIEFIVYDNKNVKIKKDYFGDFLRLFLGD